MKVEIVDLRDVHLVKPVLALLHNAASDTWHPAVYGEGTDGGRWDLPTHHLHAHHALGFASRPEAEAYAVAKLAPAVSSCSLRLDVVVEWDGVDRPPPFCRFNQRSAYAVH